MENNGLNTKSPWWPSKHSYRGVVETEGLKQASIMKKQMERVVAIPSRQFSANYLVCIYNFMIKMLTILH